MCFISNKIQKKLIYTKKIVQLYINISVEIRECIFFFHLFVIYECVLLEKEIPKKLIYTKKNVQMYISTYV